MGKKKISLNDFVSSYNNNRNIEETNEFDIDFNTTLIRSYGSVIKVSKDLLLTRNREKDGFYLKDRKGNEFLLSQSVIDRIVNFTEGRIEL